MLPPSFQKTLFDLEGKLRQIQTQLRTVEEAAKLEEAAVAYRTALDLTVSLEQAVLLARSLPACTGIPHVFFDMEQQAELQTPVKIGFTAEGWFSLRMPMLLPKKERGSAAFVRMLLLPALRRFFQRKPPVRISPCVLVFRHVYSKDRPDRAFPRYAKIGRASWEIYVVPEREFAKWLLSEKSMPEEGTELLNSPPNGQK